MRFLITFSYDGTNYSGYQKQKGKHTIQEEVEKVLKSINNDKYTKLESSGRTDKGVHALCQKAHVDIDVDITEYKLKRAMNSLLPPDIHVIETKKVDNKFHARYEVKEKEYKYLLNMGEYDPTRRNTCYQYNRELDVNSMKEAIKYFIGEHDFESFTPTVDKRENNVRIITKATICGGTTIRSYTSSLGVEGTYQKYLKVHTKEGEKCFAKILNCEKTGTFVYTLSCETQNERENHGNAEKDQ